MLGGDSALSLESCGSGGDTHCPSFQVAPVWGWRRSGSPVSCATWQEGAPVRRQEGVGLLRHRGWCPLKVVSGHAEGHCWGRNGAEGQLRLGEDSAHSGVSHTRHSGPCVCQRHSARPLSHWQEKLNVGSSHPRGDAPLGQPGDPGRALSCGSHDPALGLGSASLPVSWVQHCLLQNRFLSFVVNNSCFFSP